MGLEDIRKKIDRIDRQLVKLLGERLELAVQTRRHKTTLVDPDREEEVMANVRKLGTGLLRPGYVETIFRRIIAESRRMQGRMPKTTGSRKSRAPRASGRPGGRTKISSFDFHKEDAT